jgi:uncharacterized membrane protein
MMSGALFIRTPIVIFLFFVTPSAYAYIDPGTGSLLVQGLLAAVAGAMVTIRFYWQRIVAFFGRDKNRDSKNQDDENTNG